MSLYAFSTTGYWRSLNIITWTYPFPSIGSLFGFRLEQVQHHFVRLIQALVHQLRISSAIMLVKHQNKNRPLFLHVLNKKAKSLHRTLLLVFVTPVPHNSVYKDIFSILHIISFSFEQANQDQRKMSLSLMCLFFCFFLSWCYLLPVLCSHSLLCYFLFYYSIVSIENIRSFLDDFSVMHVPSLSLSDYCYLPLSLCSCYSNYAFCLAFVLGCFKDEHNMIVKNSFFLSICNCTTNELQHLSRRISKKNRK